MSRRSSLALAAAVAALSLPLPASAHVSSTGLARIEVTEGAVTYRLTLVADELPPEPRGWLLRAAAGDVAGAEWVAARTGEALELSVGGEPCRAGRLAIRGSALGDGRVDLELRLRCPAGAGTLLVRDRWPAVLGEHHRTLARIDGPAGSREVAFSTASSEAIVALGGTAPGGGAAGFFTLGIEHILSGWDHLLFLAVLILNGGRLAALLRIVTAFSLGHSVTLALAALGVAAVPGRVVEPAIAASIVLVAVENVRAPGAPSHRWLVSLGFGLVHGFGFASALQELSLGPGRIAAALLGFNLGVEAGQALVLLACAPALALLRRAAWEPAAVRVGSAAVGLVGLALLVGRLAGGP